MENPFYLAALTGYLFGSIPTAYWLGLAIFKINIFEHGSRNMGATNVNRVLGKIPFAITLFVDIFKGMVAVILSVKLLANSQNLILIQLTSGAFAIAGHTLSFWVKFRGGKGVATGLGVFLAITPKASVGAMLVFLITLAISGFVSLGSILGSASLPFLIFAFGEGGTWCSFFALFAFAIAVFIIFKHRSNIKRIWRGEEFSLKSP